MLVYGGIMIFCTSRILASLLFLSSATFAASSSQPEDHPGQIQDDSNLVAAVAARHNEFYVEAGNLTVSKLLPDDTSGLPHQKWQARLSNGSTITVVYNSDMGPRVPIQIGDKFAVGGQFIWTGNSGLIHWVHDDPQGHRPDGYVYFNGVVYGDTDHEDGTHKPTF